MTILNSYKFAVAFALMVGCTTAYAQKGTMSDEPVSGSGDQAVNDSWKPSLAPDGAYDKVKHVGAPIPYQPIREADVLWKKRMWREIDTREKQNIGFRYEGDENTGGGMFIEILIDAIKRGKITAYSAFGNDDRFTTKLTKEQVMEQITPKPDTVEVEDVDGTMIKKIQKKDFNPHLVSSIRIKEDWIFDRNQGKMVVRIIGIAPVLDYVGDDGGYRGSAAMFWLSYPEIRQTLSSYEVYNPQNDVYRYTWDEFFERRMFSSKITKVSNSLNQRYEDIFGTDARGKMEALYESQQNANELFNKEHDMWVY
jgi:gliding motility associated protien GldN